MPKLAITIGDPAGVGPELIARILEMHPEWCDSLVVLGNKTILDGLSIPDYCECAFSESDSHIIPGSPSECSGNIALEAMSMAANGCCAGTYSGVVTGPISKRYCRLAGMVHPGQTEFFASFWTGEPTMAFYSKRMIVSLVTWHIPLSQVASSIDARQLRRAIGHTYEFLKQISVPMPSIGVCGLNPHAGENGQMGMEEIELINPAIDKMAQEGIPVCGSFPSDTIFYRHMQGDFAAVVALYHDQGLAPLKTVAFHDAVNVSLGLAHVRTSPDHGTAFDLAGKNTAKPDSFIEAIKLAFRMIRK